MKKIILPVLVLFGFQALAQQMPMAPLQGKFSFNSDSQIANKVRIIDISAHAHDIDQLLKKYEAEGYTCAVLENDGYECGRNESITQADKIWVAKANADNLGNWLKFSAPTEDPVLEHDYGHATVWTVIQDVTAPDATFPETQYSFSKVLKNVSYFNSTSMQTENFQIVTEKRIFKEMDYTQDENGTHLEVTINCYFDRE